MRAINLNWRQAVEVRGLVITCWPAKHLGGRHWVTLDFKKYGYGGFVLRSSKRAVYFPGDSGMNPAFAELAAAFKLDLALMPIDASNRRDFLRPRHMNPSDALLAFQQSGARRMVPVHWGTFTLCNEPLGRSQELLAQALAGTPPWPPGCTTCPWEAC